MPPPPLERCQQHSILTSLAVIPSVTRGRAKTQKTVTHSEYRLWNRWPHWGDYCRVALQGVSRKLTIRGRVSISHAPCLPCLIDTISCSNCCMLTLYCLIGHSTVISQWPIMTDRHWQLASRATPLTYCFWNRNLGRIVPPRRLRLSIHPCMCDYVLKVC